MVANAPSFSEVAGQIYDLLHDKIFIAHNVNFDYSFVKHHLKDAGYDLDVRKLCTVRLARKIIPGLRAYGLNKLSRELNINLTNHHRAGGDTLATAQIFSLLVAKDEHDEIGKMLKGRNKEQYLPPHLPVEQVDKLPQTAGVYYFYNATGKVIYVGKANNIIRRVKSHFSNNKPNKQKQDFLREIYGISYKECATELMAHILESAEIRKLWPVHNRSQRGYLPRFGLLVYEDRQGYKRLAIEKYKVSMSAVYTFNTLLEGHHRLRELIREFGLCTRLCNLAKVADCTPEQHAEGCDGNCAITLTAEEYNERADEAIIWLQRQLPTFALVDKGMKDDEHSCILVHKGNFYGMGYITGNTQALNSPLQDIALLQQELEPLQDNDYIRNLIYKHAATYPEKCVAFS